MTGPSDTTEYVRPRFDLPRPLVLVGLMGVGKTTVGRRLADHFGLPFRDADEEIEKAAGQSIADIFATLGEPAFRDGEHRVIARLVDEGPQVLATGGGAFMHPQTRDLLKQKAIVVWLKTDLKVLARRVANKPHRPLLKDRDPMEVLREHEKNRYPHYAEAHLTIDTGDQSHARSVDLVLEALKTHLDI
ncbi:shikimate kinase [Asticcacaulis machinosus]|uniref:Shikimate kinase n=1 Tax=Asticcacaulis machinosus TaxID=2984211 RepID=A0ABT5HGC0_9CAUL|nr:shikimate kinase [Asticcacaulis machinosus]MDC7675298.1 shikimate kinase [Asticcacaulis machinosus]